MKRYIKASYESKFWNLHDSSYEVGSALEDIIDDKGYDILFFPESGEPEATEEDYKEVLDVYEGKGGSTKIADLSSILDEVSQALKNADGVKRAEWLDDIKALRFTLTDGKNYQLVLQNLGRM